MERKFGQVYFRTIFDKNRNFQQKWTFATETEIPDKNENSPQKAEFSTKIEMRDKNRNSRQKSKFAIKKRNFRQKIQTLEKDRNFGQMTIFGFIFFTIIDASPDKNGSKRHLHWFYQNPDLDLRIYIF